MSARRVLVVDDQEEIREMTALVLTGAGYDVQAAAGGEEALRRARQEPFDLVLLDINMPGMGGWETLRLMREDEDLAELPVAMFSVKGEVRDKTVGLQYGATDYITKPFAVDDLVARVERLLATHPRRAARS